MQKKPSAPRLQPSRHRRRMIAVQILLVVGLAGVAARIVQVQQAYGPTLLHDAAKAETVQRVLLAPRGSILDSQGNKLAFDLSAYYLDIHTSKFANLDELATVLGQALNQPADKVLPLLQGNFKWIRWPHSILEPQKEAVLAGVKRILPKTADIGDYITFTPGEQRFYPNGTFASNVIGYVNQEDVGQAGLELEYDSVLRGKDGEYTYTQQADGYPVQTSIHVTKKATPGEDVQLTLDQTIQSFVEQKMNDLVRQYHPERAAIIVMDPKNGDILAMTSRPTFDPNQYSKASQEALSSNWAVNQSFEPGSTFKVAVLTAALATHTISLNEMFDSGHMYIAGHRINDWNGIGWGRITFQQALEQSSNVGFATIALKLGWPNLLHYMKVFGFLDKTGIDLPAEANSIIFAASERGKLQLATSGFGQGISITPLQQMAFIGAIANGGTLYRPHLAKAVLDPVTHRVIKSIPPVVENPQIAPPEVVRAVNQTMILDVSEGIDKQGIIPGYDVAGKTGTAQIVDPKTGTYYPNRFNVSFIGYAPGWDPKFEVYVTLNWPKTSVGNQWGSTIATPAAADILRECLQYAHIAPRSDATPPPAPSAMSAEEIGLSLQGKTKYAQTPDLRGKPVSAAERVLKAAGLKATVIDQQGTIGQTSTVEGTVVSQWPSPGIEVAAGSQVYLDVSSGKRFERVAIVPDLTGLSMRTAGNMLAAMHLRALIHGTGYVESQSIAPGSQVALGSTVQLICAPEQNATVSQGTKSGLGSAH